MYNIDKHGQSTNITYMSAHYKALDRPLVLRVLHRHRGRGRVRHSQVGGGDHMERLQRCAAALDTLLASRRRLLHHLWVLFSLWSRWKRFSVSQNVIYLIIKTVKLFPQRWANTSKSTKTLISTQSRWRSRAGARRLSTGRRQYFQISGEVFSSADIFAVKFTMERFIAALWVRRSCWCWRATTPRWAATWPRRSTSSGAASPDQSARRE